MNLISLLILSSYCIRLSLSFCSPPQAEESEDFLSFCLLFVSLSFVSNLYWSVFPSTAKRRRRRDWPLPVLSRPLHCIPCFDRVRDSCSSFSQAALLFMARIMWYQVCLVPFSASHRPCTRPPTGKDVLLLPRQEVVDFISLQHGNASTQLRLLRFDLSRFSFYFYFSSSSSFLLIADPTSYSVQPKPAFNHLFIYSSTLFNQIQSSFHLILEKRLLLKFCALYDIFFFSILSQDLSVCQLLFKGMSFDWQLQQGLCFHLIVCVLFVIPFYSLPSRVGRDRTKAQQELDRKQSQEKLFSSLALSAVHCTLYTLSLPLYRMCISSKGNLCFLSLASSLHCLVSDAQSSAMPASDRFVNEIVVEILIDFGTCFSFISLSWPEKLASSLLIAYRKRPSNYIGLFFIDHTLNFACHVLWWASFSVFFMGRRI